MPSAGAAPPPDGSGVRSSAGGDYLRDRERVANGRRGGQRRVYCIAPAGRPERLARVLGQIFDQTLGFGVRGNRQHDVLHWLLLYLVVACGTEEMGIAAIGWIKSAGARADGDMR